MSDQKVWASLIWITSGCTRRTRRSYRFALEQRASLRKTKLKQLPSHAPTFKTSAKTLKWIWRMYPADSSSVLVEFLNITLSYTCNMSTLVLQLFFKSVCLYSYDWKKRKPAWKTRSEVRQHRIIWKMQKCFLAFWSRTTKDAGDRNCCWSDSTKYLKSHEKVCERRSRKGWHHGALIVTTWQSSKEEDSGSKEYSHKECEHLGGWKAMNTSRERPSRGQILAWW